MIAGAVFYILLIILNIFSGVCLGLNAFTDLLRNINIPNGYILGLGVFCVLLDFIYMLIAATTTKGNTKKK